MKGIQHYIHKSREYGPAKTFARILYAAFYSCAAPVYRLICKNLLPLKEHQILFASRPCFSDNSMAMYEYIVSRYGRDSRYRFVWLLYMKDEMPPELPANTRVCRRQTWYSKHPPFSTLRLIATSQYIFYTHGSPNAHFPIRPGQITMNLWHGCGYKDAPNKNIVSVQKNPFSYALVPGQVFVEKKACFWGCEPWRVLPIGYPRYDLLKEDNDPAGKLMAGISKGFPVVLWMPTFRDSRKGSFPEDKAEWGYDLPLLSSDEELAALDEYCVKKNLIICIKRHTLQKEYSCDKNGLKNIVFIEDRDLAKAGVQLYSFLRYSSALISDYSSVSVDYLLLDRPVAYTLDDYELYRDTRGFVFENPLDYMPGYHLYNLEDLFGFLEDVVQGRDSCTEERRRLMPLLHNPCDHYCERVWDTTESLRKGLTDK